MVPNSEPNIRQVYLITYSQADVVRFPTRRDFTDIVIRSFDGCPGQIVQWCCCLEEHRDEGWHYHMALKFDRTQRWLTSKRRLLEDGVSVHFSDTHTDYYSAWRYVNKEDRDTLHSVGHPDLGVAPRTTNASSSVHSRRRISISQANEEDASSEVQKQHHEVPHERKKGCLPLNFPR